MSFLVDTSVLLGLGTPPDAEEWAVSSVTIGEMQAGTLLAEDAVERAERLGVLSDVFDEADGVIPVDVRVANAYAVLRAAVGREPSNDMWIAATARAHDLVLVTADKQMAKYPGVRTQLVG